MGRRSQIELDEGQSFALEDVILNGRRGDHRWGEEVWDTRIPVKFVKDGKVVVGKDGWLFLDNDRNDYLGQYSGQVQLADEQLADWRQVLEERIAGVEEFGARYYFMIAPESPAVYPEKLPDTVEVADERTVQQLMRYLASTGSRAKVIYPLEELLAQKSVRAVYPKIDTHWNDYGAFVAYRRLAEELDKDVPIHKVTEKELEFFEDYVPGDLGYKLGVAKTASTFARYVYPRARLLSDNQIYGHGSLIVLENRHAPPTTCVFFGDSFSYPLITFLAQTFGRLVWTWMSTLDYDLIAAEQPDVVISEMTERFLIEVPDDASGKSLRRLEKEKKERGDTRPRLVFWNQVESPPRVLQTHSVEAVEKIRSRFLASGRLEEATLVSVMAYAGLSPSDALPLRWREVKEGALELEPPVVGAESPEEERLRIRRVPLLEPLMEDLEEWRAACGGPKLGYVFPGLRARDWLEWVNGDYWHVTRFAGRGPAGKPYHLRHTLCQLLIEQGESLDEVARQMAMTRDDTVELYGHLFEEARLREPVSASSRIRAVREARSSRSDVSRLVSWAGERLGTDRFVARMRGLLG